MRQGLIALTMLCLATSPADAQRRTGVLTGISGGATLSDFQDPDTDSRWGGTAGLWIGRATYHSLVMLEVNWIQKGGADTRLDYIEIPLTFGGVGRASGGTSRARFYTGVSVAFKIDCSSELAVDPCPAAEGTEWGLPLGLMLGRWSSRERVVAIDARYTFPLSEAFPGGIDNQTWQFRVMIGRTRGQ